jgi:hypothetical protein
MEIVSFDPPTAGRSDWERFHTYRHARRAESDPDEPVISDAEVEEERQPHPHVIRLRSLALDEGRLVRSSVALLPTRESPGYAGAPRVLDPDNTRIIAYRYEKENIPDLIAEVKAFRQKLLARNAGDAKATANQACWYRGW